MKKLFLISIILILGFNSFCSNPIYVTFNCSYLIDDTINIEHHGLNVWKFDKDSMTLTFFYNMKTFPIISWEESENNRKEIVADLEEFTAAIRIGSPWLMAILFVKPNENGTINSMYMEVFYLEKLPSWFMDDEVGGYWEW
ncbi:MAG: hypothetical protein KQH79_01090 [Bacteroidetes bacterium]|nr:hypothetical protein [Bacteroidota bacterium]